KQPATWARVGQREAQRVRVPDEAAVDDGHALRGRNVGQGRGGVLGSGDLADVEPERTELVFKR
ncbi:hypothetical protein PL81_08445, partial [Streptomyces sp. RSD-27]